MNLPANSIRLLTFNILYDSNVDSKNIPLAESQKWESRKKQVFALLRFHAPDVFCLQEPLKNQIIDFENAFPKYDSESVGCLDGKEKGQHMSIFYLREKFEKLCCGHFWLSETPNDMGSVGWDAKNRALFCGRN